MILFVKAAMEADKRADLRTMSTEGVNKILEGLNKKVAGRASNLAGRIIEQSENKNPGTQDVSGSQLREPEKPVGAFDAGTAVPISRPAEIAWMRWV